MKDMKGSRIWENDILQCDFGDDFGEDMQRFHIVFSDGTWKTKDIYGCEDKLNDFTCEYGEIIGNVFDNPEMMEVGR
jgi:hypothetical protein